MDREQLEQAFKMNFDHIAQTLASQASGSLQDFAAMECAIYEAMNSLKATTLQTWANAARDDSGRPTCPICGGKMRQKQRAEKTCICEGGQVTVGRTRWWCDACQASFFPSGQHGHGLRPSDHPAGRQDGR